jgi:hypothetical protein
MADLLSREKPKTPRKKPENCADVGFLPAQLGEDPEFFMYAGCERGFWAAKD